MSLQIEANIEPIAGYRLIERIGGGGFGEVWKAEAPGGLLKAIKIIHGDLRSVDADGARHAEQELRALKRLQGIRHPYLLSLERYDVVEGRLLIVTELADCNLWDRFRQCRSENRPGIPRGELLRYLEEAAEVLDLMNNQYQLQHLDIKPQNLFLVYNHVKVADFGLVKDLEGMRGTITGGVTPVYAAPETFDSVLTRYCDQYSLAIVYQELLTGVRPFNGSSGQQLLMQHIREAPNLGPLAPADRPVVGRALSKKPEDRFPSCLQFVHSLVQNGSETNSPVILPVSSGRLDTPRGTAHTLPPMPPPVAHRLAEPQPAMETPKTQLNFPSRDSFSQSQSYIDEPAPVRMAPPEITGEGTLRPAVIIGIGEIGLQVLRQFRTNVEDSVGSLERVPNLRTIFIDTDSEALHAAATGAGRLESAAIIPARLNRAAHYLKPRRNGRSLIEGWFDPQMLYRIPRNPSTVGMRSLGRLAFLDHYKAFSDKLTIALDDCTQPDALSTADRHTRLGHFTNRPRVYIVCSLGGGTGAGMFLDVAYAVRYKLRQMGYTDAEVIGQLVLPPADRTTRGPALTNAYTALRELHHFSQPDTVFTADYEEREGAAVRDPAPPFSRCFLSSLPSVPRPGQPVVPEEPGNSVPARIANLLTHELLSPMGRIADQIRDEQFAASPGEINFCSFGQSSYVWPKQSLLSHTARWLSTQVLRRWVSADPEGLTQYVNDWLTQRWQIEELGIEPLLNRLSKSGDIALGQPASELFENEAAPFAARGWFARDPDPAKLWQSISRLQQIVGMPDERAMQRSVGSIEHRLHEVAESMTREYAGKITRLAVTLLEHPDYRLVGANEVVEQLQKRIDAMLKQYETMAYELGAKAIDAYYLLHSYLQAEKGQRRPTPAELAEAIRIYPTSRYESLIIRQACRILQTGKVQLADQLRDLNFCRQRLEEVMKSFLDDRRDAFPTMERTLLPQGVSSATVAATRLQDSISSEDLRAFDKKLQVRIEQEFTALFNVCLSSMNMLGSLQATIEEQAKSFLAPRLGEADLGKMFCDKFSNGNSASQAMRWLHDQAAAKVSLLGCDKNEMVLMGGPGDDSGRYFRELAEYSLEQPPTEYVMMSSEIMIYREHSQIPLTALPQLGPLGEEAYNNALDAPHGTPHSRTDIVQWQDVEIG
jgi:serine/threonine protein kinase